jgi:pyruvate,orthophosphate dikinase
VAGIRTPKPIAELEKLMPSAYRQLRTITSRLERHYRDVQEFEFTIQDEQLYMLQTRSGKRTGYAAVVIATDLVAEKRLSSKEALSLVDPESLTQLLVPIFDPKAWRALPTVTKGLPASPGAASGHAVFTSADAVLSARKGEPALLIRKETVPDDIHGMHAAQGVLTATGGLTSHAAVVGRQMGKPSVVGAGELEIDEGRGRVRVGGVEIIKGEYLSFDGLTGEVKCGQVATKPSEILQVLEGNLDGNHSDIFQRFERLLRWADAHRRLGVRANADLADQATIARAFGAEGIGLCRTEHMFFGEERLPVVQQMIMADNETDRRAALDELLPFQRDDFYDLFKVMEGQPVTIRLIDPPLHEFLPKREELMVDIAVAEARDEVDELIESKRQVLRRVEQLREFNPMLGHRGVRLGITYPEITEMQSRAIIEAACRLTKEGVKVIPEIMIPLVGDVRELRAQRAVVDRVAVKVMDAQKVKVRYLVGTMIEVPRSSVTANEIALEADFFSFGTNDLTQMGYGFSRDDAGRFLRIYQDLKLIDRDPFQSIDTVGIGDLVRIGVERGRQTRPNLKLGVCGEHGGDAASVHFFHEVGLDYVSASPFRIPVARLAAAQAALRDSA